MVFTALFSYFVLVRLGPTNEEDSPSLQEYLTWGWCATMVLEEFRQVGPLRDWTGKKLYLTWSLKNVDRLNAVPDTVLEEIRQVGSCTLHNPGRD